MGSLWKMPGFLGEAQLWSPSRRLQSSVDFISWLHLLMLFSVLFCSLLEALSLWQIDGVPGGVPSGRAAICPPPTSTIQRQGWAP